MDQQPKFMKKNVAFNDDRPVTIYGGEVYWRGFDNPDVYDVSPERAERHRKWKASLDKEPKFMKDGETIYDSYPEHDGEYNFSIPPDAAQDHNNDMVVATGDMLPPRKNCKQCGQCSAVFIKGKRFNVGHPAIARAFFKSWGFILKLKQRLFG